MKIQNTIILILFVALFAGCKSGPTMVNGYEYEILKDVDGPTAQPGDFVAFALKIMGDDGTVLEDMKEGPQMPRVQIPKVEDKTKAPNPVISLLKFASLGDSLKLIMPVDSIERAPANIAEMEFVTYNMSIKQVETEVEYNTRMETERLELEAAGELLKARIGEVEAITATSLAAFEKGGSDIITDEATGLKYIIHEEGTGPKPVDGDKVTAAYHGVFKDGNVFDSSFKTGRKFSFVIGARGAIQGWDQGFKLFNKGSKATLYVPYNMAYGETGRPPSIPAKSDLVFYVELDN